MFDHQHYSMVNMERFFSPTGFLASHTKLIGIDDHPMERVGVGCCQVAEGKSWSSVESWTGGDLKLSTWTLKKSARFYRPFVVI